MDDGQGCFELVGNVSNQGFAFLLRIPSIVQGGVQLIDLRFILRQGLTSLYKILDRKSVV